jgi:hypothetical protein
MAQHLEKYKDDFVLLCEAGFVAVNQMDEPAALQLFKAAALLKPENTLPKVGMGYMNLLQLKLKEACAAFNEVLAKEPDNEMAKTFLGLSLSFTPTEVAKGEQILEQSAQKAKDPSIKTLASSALTFIDKFVKHPLNIMDPIQKKKTKEKE